MLAVQNVTNAVLAGAVTAEKSVRRAGYSAAAGIDQVELTGLTVSAAIERVDQARLADLRERIANGTYLTDRKLDFVAERLQEILHTPPQTRAVG